MLMHTVNVMVGPYIYTELLLEVVTSSTRHWEQQWGRSDVYRLGSMHDEQLKGASRYIFFVNGESIPDCQNKRKIVNIK